MPNTTNFNFPTPADTDLVKDGASAIRSLGNSIDTAFVDLKGGTTGQVLSKASNTDLDFTWVAQDDSNAIQNAIVDAKGDLISATAADTPARLAVGANNTVLTADSTTATGLKWAAAGGGGPSSWSALNGAGTALTGATKITVTFSAVKELFIFANGISSANASSDIFIRLNDDSTLKYTNGVFGARLDRNAYTTFADNSYFGADSPNGAERISWGRLADSADSTGAGMLYVTAADTTTYKTYQFGGSGYNAPSAYNLARASVGGIGFYTGTSAITSVSINSSTGNFDGGTIYVYGGN